MYARTHSPFGSDLRTVSMPILIKMQNTKRDLFWTYKIFKISFYTFFFNILLLLDLPSIDAIGSWLKCIHFRAVRVWVQFLALLLISWSFKGLHLCVPQVLSLPNGTRTLLTPLRRYSGVYKWNALSSHCYQSHPSNWKQIWLISQIRIWTYICSNKQSGRETWFHQNNV